MQTNFKFHNQLLWPLLISLVFAASRFWRLTASCLWFDEIFSVHAATHSWSELFHFTAADMIHPPLFYVLLKIWIAVGGEGLLWLRLLPALIAVAAIVPFWLLCRELKLNHSVVNLALLFLAVSGYLIKYAQEVRMYSLLFLLSLGSLWLFFRLVHRNQTARRELALLTLVNLLMVYTHYAGWLLVFVQAVVIGIWYRQRLWSFLRASALLVLAYSPWIYEVYKVSHSGITGRGISENIGWVTKPGISELLQYFVILNRPFLFVQSSAQVGYNLVIGALVLILFALPLVFLLARTPDPQEPKRDHSVVALSVFFVAPAILAFVISWISPHSVWGTRHLIITAAPYAILAAQALITFKPAWGRTTLLAVYGTWLCLSGAIFFFSRQQTFIWCSWEPLAQQVAAEQTGTSKPVNLYAYEDLVAYHLWFALRSNPSGHSKVTVIKGVEGINEDPAYFLPRAFQDVAVTRNQVPAGENTWIAFRANRWNENVPPLDSLKKNGFEVGRTFSFKAQGQEAFLVQIK